MKIQSLSVVVPTKSCVNNCSYCISRGNDMYCRDVLEGDEKGRQAREDLRTRLAFARDNECNTLVITGTGEPLQNRAFLNHLGMLNSTLTKPFRWIELQTTGVMLDDEACEMLRYNVGVTTISLSIANLFDDVRNMEIQGVPDKLQFKMRELTERIHRHGFLLRVCLNMTRDYLNEAPEDIFRILYKMGARQVTFRVLTKVAENEHNAIDNDILSSTNDWIDENALSAGFVDRTFGEYVRAHGRVLERLPFGATRYSVEGHHGARHSVVIDDDCMNREEHDVDAVRYLILRPNCRLYTRWDDEGSILF